MYTVVIFNISNFSNEEFPKLSQHELSGSEGYKFHISLLSPASCHVVIAMSHHSERGPGSHLRINRGVSTY